MTARRPRQPRSPMAFPVHVPFVEDLGLELHGMGHGQADLRVDLDAGHLNHWEVAHGGVVMTMLDVAMAMAARSTLGEGMGVATIEMKTSFMKAAEGRLRAVGKVVHKTSTLAFCSAELHDDGGALCASASGTFKFLRGLRGGRRAPGTADAHPTPHGSSHGGAAGDDAAQSSTHPSTSPTDANP